ncbi:MAG: NAD-dependent epimerase/dehydratase family protein [Myxococcales bacterium]
MKVVVSGGAGFIGSHVCDSLLARGHEVIALDDLSSGNPANLDARVRLARFDIRSPEAHKLIVDEKPQALMHLAAQMDVRRSVADPRFDADVNVMGMINLLEACVKAGTKRVVFSSTGGAIYGEQDTFPADENHAKRPCSPYGVSKAAGELYLNYFFQQYGLSYAALRYSNVYGPRQNPHGEAGVVAIFCSRLLEGRTCTIYGDGKQTRDFVYVADVAKANVAALESDYVGAVNIGTGLETDVNELYTTLAQVAGLDVAAEHAPGKPGEQRRSCIDPALAKKLFGWSATVNLKDGLRETYGFFKAKHETPARAAV